MKRIEEGSSWLVGARPGGAGKTAGMTALLAILPENEEIVLTESESGCRLVTNLHADTLEQARARIVDENGVPDKYFPSFGIFIPITVRSGSSGVRRTVRKIHSHSDGKSVELMELDPMSAREKEIAGFLEDLLHDGIRTVEEVRRKWCLFRNRCR